jgi:hypothetical protein
MGIVEICCVALLLTSALLRRRGEGAREWLADAPIVGLSAWVAEDSTIRTHGFYHYDPSWHFFVDVTPLLIPTIWIMVVLSARDVAREVAPRQLAGVVFFLVWFDANLIEPICTHAGMWRWTEPGPFAVPYIGTLGWASFGASAVFWLSRLRGRWRWLTVVLAPLTMHALLLAFWWGALRWFGRATPPPEAAAAAAWIAALLLAVAVVALGRARSLTLDKIAPRLLPAAFFFALLAAHAAPPLLWLYAASFAVPWLAATRWAWTRALSAPSPARP